MTIGQFRVHITQKLGQTRNSQIFKAFDKAKCSVAAKKFMFSGQEKLKPFMTVEGLLEDVKGLTKLRKHSNVVSYLDCFHQDDHLWLFIDCYADLGDLGHYILQQHPTLSTVENIMLQCSNALEFLHSQNHPPVVHGNLKIQNILVKKENDQDVFKITDFGITGIINKYFDDEGAGTASSFCLASIGISERVNPFAAPEAFVAGDVLKTKGITQEADIFSLGLVYHVLLQNAASFENPGLIPKCGK